MTEVQHSQINRVGVFKGEWTEICQFCGKPQLEHREAMEFDESPTVEWRKPCDPEKGVMKRDWTRKVRVARSFVFVGWILIPLAIAILGFTSPIVGACAFAVSLGKIGLEAIKHYGNPNKWIPGYAAKMEKERRMKHYFWHCEKNPEGFARLKAENFDKE